MELTDMICGRVKESFKNQNQPESVFEAMIPFIEKLPNLLSNLLDEPVNIKNFMTAKVVFMRYCLDSGFCRAIAEATPDELLGAFDSMGLMGVLEGMLSMLVNQLEGLTVDKNIKELLEYRGLTEDSVILSPQLGLNFENQELYKNGELTIRKLLETQPMIIIEND